MPLRATRTVVAALAAPGPLAACAAAFAPSPPGTQPIKTSCGQTVYVHYIFEGSPRVSIQYTTQVGAAT